MTRQKWFLVVAAAAFVGWIAYLGYAVACHRLNPPDIVSRSQLTEAGYVAVVEVAFDGDKPTSAATVVHRLSDFGPESGVIGITNLPSATTPANLPLPGPGKYLVALVGDGFDPQTGPYRIAGWPRGLGESVTQPGTELKDTEGKPFDPPKRVRPPLAYPWTDAVQKQMTALGYKW